MSGSLATLAPLEAAARVVPARRAPRSRARYEPRPAYTDSTHDGISRVAVILSPLPGPHSHVSFETHRPSRAWRSTRAEAAGRCMPCRREQLDFPEIPSLEPGTRTAQSGSRGRESGSRGAGERGVDEHVGKEFEPGQRNGDARVGRGAGRRGRAAERGQAARVRGDGQGQAARAGEPRRTERALARDGAPVQRRRGARGRAKRGRAVARDREYMSRIGRAGAKKSAAVRSKKTPAA